jgi:tetratricopeptide (TPR) repeat protein
MGLLKLSEGTTQEQIDACMHMLRHLGDPHALRRNTLVAPLFSSARSERSPRRAFARECERLRKLVESAAEALRSDDGAGDAPVRERQYQILRRCDLDREPRETVMRDLGISRRQYYRDRSAACEYVTQYLVKELRPVEHSPIVAIDLFTAGHERARTLRHAGEVERSIGALRDLIAQPVSALKRTSAWIALVELLNDDGRGEEASRELSELRRFALTRSQSSTLSQQLQQLVALQEGSVMWALGEEGKALDADEATQAALQGLARPNDSLIAAAVIKSYLSRAQRAFLVGDYDASNKEIARAGELMERCENLPLAHRLQFLLLDGDRRIFSPEEIRDAQRPLAEVASAAQAQGNLEYLSVALGDLALFAQTYGDLDTAISYSRESVSLARHAAPRGIRGHLLLNSAEVAYERGHARESIALATEAQNCFPESGVGASVSWYHIARALLLVRDYAGACEAAEKLRQNAMRGGNRRLLGSGLRLLAQAYHSLGAADDAREHIDAAISVLKRFGHPFALRAVYSSSAKITGRAEHSRMAREISATFKLSA